MSYSYLFKIIVIGDSGVGKTSLLSSFSNIKYCSEYAPTIGVEFHTRILDINDVNIKLHIWDTAGQERFRSITRSYYNNSVGAIICYDITRSETFTSIQKWLDECDLQCEHVNIMLVGNKSDLDCYRQVSYKDGFEFAKKNGISFTEVSSKNSVENMFRQLTSDIYGDVLKGKHDVQETKFPIGLSKNNSICCNII